MFRTLSLFLFLAVGNSAVTVQAQAQLQDELRALDALRKGAKTPFDQVDRRGEALLEEFPEPAQQAQIHYQLAHVHAQSGLKHPATILAHAQKALESKLITPQQRGTLYSYMSSAHEVDPAEKDFAVRRRNAIQPLLLGLKECQAFSLPDLPPELPVIPLVRGDFEKPAEAARLQREREAAMLARKEVERTRDLVRRRDVLSQQVRSLYARDPAADDELQKLATEQLGAEQAKRLLDDVKAERKRRQK